MSFISLGTCNGTFDLTGCAASRFTAILDEAKVDTLPEQASIKEVDYLPAADDMGMTQARKDLLRFAMLHLRNRELAEDIVQETLMAALAAKDRFAKDHR